MRKILLKKQVVLQEGPTAFRRFDANTIVTDPSQELLNAAEGSFEEVTETTQEKVSKKK